MYMSLHLLADVIGRQRIGLSYMRRLMSEPMLCYQLSGIRLKFAYAAYEYLMIMLQVIIQTLLAAVRFEANFTFLFLC